MAHEPDDHAVETKGEEPTDSVKQRLSFEEEKSGSDAPATPSQSEADGSGGGGDGSSHLSPDEDR